MRKQQTEYSSPLDALVAITKRLTRFENQRSTSSEEFFDRYRQGQMSDEADLIDWANDYRHYASCQAPYNYIPKRSYPLLQAREVLRLLAEEGIEGSGKEAEPRGDGV